jgi:hypothetical protein
MRFASPLQFATPAADQTTKNESSRAISLLARTKKVLYHWYWGPCVHDFAGMTQKERIALDWAHDRNELVGFSDQSEVTDEGLRLAGRLESIEPGDRAQKIIKQSDVGIPFEASIYFDDVQLEWIPEGYTTTVNGEQLNGPLTVFRKWLLRACSVVPYGYDSDSVSEVEDDSETELQWANSMSKEQITTPATAPLVDPRVELKQFTDRFGVADGADYFTRNVSMADATAEHLTKLSARHENELSALKASHAEAITKLSAERDTIAGQRDTALAKIEAAKLSIGEAEGVDVGKPGQLGSPSKPATSMTEARLAAAKK